jgi:hypothetical protein
MDRTEQSMEAIQDIKRMMERSSRFISLSGWSGVSAGTCALIGAWLAVRRMAYYKAASFGAHVVCRECIVRDFMIIAACVFGAAFITAFLFTYQRSKSNGIPIWGTSARRLMWNTVLPMAAGAFVIWRMLQEGHDLLIAPSCLIFYGLALVNGSKYTLGEVRYLGYAQIVLGIISLWVPGYGLVFWALGFGVFHIIYGVSMWWKYEKA